MQRVRGERWLLAPSSFPGLSITTSQILHLTCTISKPLAQVLLPRSPTNNTTLIFHTKPLGKPGFWGHAQRPPAGTENALLCTLCITCQGGRAGSQSHSGCPSPCAPGGQQLPRPLSPTVPVLGWLLQTLLAWERGAPTAPEGGKEGMPLGCLPSGPGEWDGGGIPVPHVGSWGGHPLPFSSLRMGLGGPRCATALGAAVCTFVCPAHKGGSGRGKDGTDISGGISGGEERSLPC